MSRIRHCVECPKCLTRYLVSCSPYVNGAYLLPAVEGCQDEYILYCSCRAPASWWKASEFKTCDVSTAAFVRGYGNPAEIRIMNVSEEEWSVDVSRYLNDWKSMEKRRI